MFLDIYPVYWTKWNCVTVQKYFPTGQINSSPLKIPGTIFCVVFFLLLMTGIWIKFKNKMTHTGSRNIYNKDTDEKIFQVIIVCPMGGFKQPGFFFDEKTFSENCFKLEEIFSPNTTNLLQNKSTFFAAITSILVCHF